MTQTTGRGRGMAFYSLPKLGHVAVDYGTACDVGRHYAAEYVQWAKEHPGLAETNTLACIAAELDEHPRGTNVGFRSTIGALLARAAASENHWVTVDLRQRRAEAIEAERNAENAAELAISKLMLPSQSRRSM